MKNDKKRVEQRRDDLLLSPLLLSCRTNLLSTFGAAFSHSFVNFSHLRAAHYRPNVPQEGSDHPGATPPRVGAYAPAWGQEVSGVGAP